MTKLFSTLTIKMLQVIMTFAIVGYSQNIIAIQVLTENSPPYHYLENGVMKGTTIKTVKAILDCAKIEDKIVMLPWKRAYQTTLNNKNTLLFSLARTTDRETKFIWIAPIFSSTAYLYKLKSRKDIQINTMQDLNGYSIGALPDDYKTKYLLSLPNHKQFTIHYFSKRRSQILMLANGRFDLTVNDPDTFMEMIGNFNLDPNDFEQLIPLGPPLILYLAINKDSDIELIKQLKSCEKSLDTALLKSKN